MEQMVAIHPLLHLLLRLVVVVVEPQMEVVVMPETVVLVVVLIMKMDLVRQHPVKATMAVTAT
jgi:hypothetical protein